MQSVAVLVPVQNEAGNVIPLVKRINAALSQAQIEYEVIFVDDHSKDKTVSQINSLKKKFPVRVFTKKGRAGKAYSILEAAEHTDKPYLVMIDADLQYPPEAIPEMLKLTQHAGIVVAKRRIAQQSAIRKVASRGFQFVFGKLLYGFSVDVQSGLKVFKRDILNHLNKNDVSPWTIDVPLLHTGLELGYTIDEVEIEFSERNHGESKIYLLSSIREIGGQAIRYKLKEKHPFTIPPDEESSMVGAGLHHQGRKFVTHTTLEEQHSAIKTFTSKQKILFSSMIAFALLSILLQPYWAALTIVAFMSVIYFSDVIFNLVLILRSLHNPPEISISETRLAKLSDADLPMYTVLCPLYKEAHVLPFFLKSISKLDWPKKKLDVLLLLEEDDVETIAAANAMDLPAYVRILVIPDSQPKTKPKACNFGLSYAKGEYLVIYDAEDMPDPQQLKKVYLAYQQSPEDVKCIQAKLNYYNSSQNLLTRFFTAEYSLWFDVILTGLQSIKTVIPLGGTSNHFKTAELLKLQGWDPFNVTEDCDLGIRLFKSGAKTAIIDSVTLEEANSDWRNWLRQRSRWIKGYMQSYLVHIRHPLGFLREQGIHAIFFHLSVGGKILFLLINPFMWLLTISYFTLYAYVGPAIESLYPSVIFYMAVFSLVFGNFMFIYYYMIGLAKRQQWYLIKFVLLVPLYWIMASIAASIALYQLIVKPHYWEKTVHGLHLKKDEIEEKIVSESGMAVAQSVAQVLEDRTRTEYTDKEQRKIVRLITSHKVHLAGLVLIMASVGSNFINFIFNAYLGRTLSLADFGTLGLINSFFYLAMIPFGAITATLTFQAGYLDNRYGREVAVKFWKKARKKSWVFAVISSVIWVLSIPLLMPFFNTHEVLPFLIFVPVLMLGIPLAVDRGLLSGLLMFGTFGVLLMLESITKMLGAVLLVSQGLSPLIYLVIPGALIIPFVAGWYWIKRSQSKALAEPVEERGVYGFPRRFFGMSMMSGLAQMSFLSLDVLLVKHYLLPVAAGEYNLIALVGKMIFFGGTIASQFVIPLVSRNVGAKKDTSTTLKYALGASMLLTGLGVLALGVFSPLTTPILFGERIVPLTQYLAPFTFGMMCFVLSKVFVTYYLAKKIYLFAILSFALAGVQVLALTLFHASLDQVVNVMMIIGIINLLGVLALHRYLFITVSIQNNADALISLIFRNGFSKRPLEKEKLKILFFNWRDTRHVWAGGAEVYVQRIAKNLVADGHKVTVFCGNDGNDARNQVIDGVQIVRRGGFYTVYIWAFLYYVLRFRGAFDVVVDCENGIPFFTPLYVSKPKLLLIHHVHQEVFRSQLKFPFSLLAEVIEGKLMPLVYHNQPVVTVSESSQKDIERIGLGGKQKIAIVHSGVDAATSKSKKNKKTLVPSFLYLGRLKPYKNIDVAIKAFKEVLTKYPKAILNIAGDGENRDTLIKLTQDLGLSKSVIFLGKVSEEHKHQLLASSWIMVQPSDMEGWGITVIEANTYSTPVIASDTAGLRDSVQDGKSGILVPPRDSDLLAKAMVDLVKNSKRRRLLSKNALEWSKQFSWKRSTKEFLAVIRSNIFESVPALKLGEVHHGK